MKARARAVVIVLIVALSSGCAAGGYNADSLHDRLVRAGLRPTQATCVINAMVAKFGEGQLNARAAPIAAELRTERTLLRKCKVEPKAEESRRVTARSALSEANPTVEVFKRRR